MLLVKPKSLTFRTSKSRTTPQLQNEEISLNIVAKYLEEKGLNIEKYFSSYENKMIQTTGDILAVNQTNQKVKVSVKNKGGLMTLHNLGTGIKAVKQWYSPTPKDDYFLFDLKKSTQDSLRRRRKISATYTRWDDIKDKKDQAKQKDFVISPLLECFYDNFIEHPEILQQLMNYLHRRESHMTIVTHGDGIFNVIQKDKEAKQILDVEIDIFIKNKSIIEAVEKIIY